MIGYRYCSKGGFVVIRIACCDDKKEEIELIKNCIDNWKEKPSDVFFTYFSDADTLIRSHTHSPFDILLLDIVMPLLNGIEAAREIRQMDQNVKIIFLSSSSEYGVESYTVQASNYLLKPFTETQLISCLQTELQHYAKKEKMITIKSQFGFCRVPIRELEYLEAQNKHVLFCLSNGSSIESIQPFNLVIDDLTVLDGFFKCHRSYAVNLYQIVTYTSKEITMKSGKNIPIARSIQKQFEEAYFSLFFKEEGDFQ